MRHSLALPAAEGGMDEERILSEDGIALAHRRRESMIALEGARGVAFDLIIASNRLRTQQTALIVAGDEAPMIVDRRLFEQKTAHEHEMMDAFYKRIGEKSLGEYLQHGTLEESHVLLHFARSGWKAVMKEVGKRPGVRRVLVVNHALFAPAMIFAGTGLRYPFILNAWWTECYGATVTLEGGSASNVTLLPLLG